MKPIFTFIFFIGFFCAIAQPKTPILERKITISLNEEKIINVLNQVAQQGKFSFSYNASIINSDQVVTVAATNKSVREVLNQIFKGTMDYKEKSSHLILTKVPIRQTESTTAVVIVSGYVEDANTKEKIPDASVYDKKSITSVVTDEYGYFRMKLDKKDKEATIAVSKKNYKDTLVAITAPSNQYLNISITPITTDSVIIKAETMPVDSVKEEKKEEKKEEERFIMPYEDEPNVQNISDTLYRDIQISFLPFLGSNGKLSGNIINDYSINMLGGYSLGTRQIELGFFFNLDRGNVKWLQIAGFGNVVGGDVFGIQGAGAFNINRGTTVAAQAAGFGNLNFKSFSGVQWGGFGNFNLSSVHGVSVAGFMNTTNGESRGAQIAGFMNIQSKNLKGFQIAGFSNIADAHVDGSQVSAFFNYGKKVRGTQFGILNVADSMGGVPIGLLSIVKQGYHKIEISADEVFYTNLAFRSGVRQFYNIISASIQPQESADKKTVWAFGYGLGTAPRLNRWLDLNIDFTSQHISKGDFTDELSTLNKVYLGFDFHLAKKFSITTGVTVNGYLTKSTYTEYPVLFTDYKPSMIYDHTYDNNTNFKLWLGGKVGIRFL